MAAPKGPAPHNALAAYGSGRDLLRPILLALAVFIAFGPAFGADFVKWDDTHNFVNNERIRRPSGENVIWFWKNGYKDLYVPVTYTVWSAAAWVARVNEVDASGRTTVALNPYIFHALNILLHAGAALAAYALLRRLVRWAWAAWLGAAVFALHPVQVESVAWASGTKDVLAGLLALVALWQYCLAADAGRAVGQRRACYAIATVAFVLAMLSKPSAVVVPLIAALIDWGLLRRPARQVALWAGSWLVLAVPVVVIAKAVQPATALDFAPPVWGRPVVALDALAFYLRQLLLPLGLAIDYGRSPRWLWQSPHVYFTWLAPVAVAAVLVAVRRRVRFGAFGATIFALALAPVLGLVPFDFQSYSTVTDHYLYLAMLGPALIVAGVVTRFEERRKEWSMVTGIGALLVVALGVRTFAQAGHWRDSESLFSHALIVNAQSVAGSVNLGIVRQEQARNADAAARLAQGRGDAATAGELYQRAIAASEQAMALYRRALATAPDDFLANRRLGEELAWYRHHRYSEAAEHFERALRRQPDSADTHVALAAVLANLKDYQGSEAHLREALRLIGRQQEPDRALEGMARQYLQRLASQRAAATTRSS